jgi:hypothetical protein
MAAVGIRLSDRIYGLSQEQAQFLAGLLQRRMTIPEPVAALADQLWAESMRNPDAGHVSRDILLDDEQKRELLDTMSKVRPDGETEAWDELRDALRRELGSLDA